MSKPAYSTWDSSLKSEGSVIKPGSDTDKDSAFKSKREVFRRILTAAFMVIASQSKTADAEQKERFRYAVSSVVHVLNRASGFKETATVFTDATMNFFSFLMNSPEKLGREDLSDLQSVIKNGKKNKLMFIPTFTEHPNAWAPTADQKMIDYAKTIAGLQNFAGDDDKEDDKQHDLFLSQLKACFSRFMFFIAIKLVNSQVTFVEKDSVDSAKAVFEAVGVATDLADVLASWAGRGMKTSLKKIEKLESDVFGRGVEEIPVDYLREADRKKFKTIPK